MIWCKESSGKKDDDTFSWRITGGGLEDGGAHGGSGELVFTKDGKGYVLQGQTSLGDGLNDPLKDQYKRLDSNK